MTTWAVSTFQYHKHCCTEWGMFCWNEGADSWMSQENQLSKKAASADLWLQISSVTPITVRALPATGGSTARTHHPFSWPRSEDYWASLCTLSKITRLLFPSLSVSILTSHTTYHWKKGLRAPTEQHSLPTEGSLEMQTRGPTPPPTKPKSAFSQQSWESVH